MARLTKKQVAERERAAREQERLDAAYELQESKRAVRIQVDQNMTLWVWLVGLGVGFISSAIVSFNGITGVAPLVGLSADWMAYLFFFFVEVFYLVFLFAYLLQASRGEKGIGSQFGFFLFGGIAVLANAFHTIQYHEYNLVSVETWAGVVLSVSAPVAIIAASKLASTVVFAKAVRLGQ